SSSICSKIARSSSCKSILLQKSTYIDDASHEIRFQVPSLVGNWDWPLLEGENHFLEPSSSLLSPSNHSRLLYSLVKKVATDLQFSQNKDDKPNFGSQSNNNNYILANPP